MKIIDLHISREIFGRSVVVGIWLVGIYLFVTMLDLLENSGGESNIIGFVETLAYSLPRMIYELSPMILLIGSMLALSNLSQKLELVAFQAGGVSKMRITASVVGFSMLVATFMFIWGETVVPLSESVAWRNRTSSDSDMLLSQSENGIWARYGSSFIFIGQIDSDWGIRNISIYEFDDDGNFVKQINAAQANSIDGRDVLKLEEVEALSFAGNRIDQQLLKELDYPIKLEIETLHMQRRDPNELGMIDLLKSIEYRQINGLKSDFLRLTFWNKIIIPLSMIIMGIFAMLFTFRQRAGLGTGHFVFIGLFFGLVYFAIQQSVGYIALLNGISPVVGTFAVLITSLMGACYLLFRT